MGRLERTLEDAGIPHDVTVYPGVGHSFMNRADLNPVFEFFGSVVMDAGYDEEAAEDAWGRILEFFGEVRVSVSAFVRNARTDLLSAVVG